MSAARQQLLLGGSRPAPRELRCAVPGEPVAAEERPHAGRQQNGRDQRHTSRRRGQMTTRCRPDGQREARGREGVDVELEPQIARGDRLVEHARRCGQRDRHQRGGAPALPTRRPAEERPPDDDRPRAGEPARHGDQTGPRFGAHERRPEPKQHQQECGRDAGPQPEGATRRGPGRVAMDSIHTRPDALRTRFVPGATLSSFREAVPPMRDGWSRPGWTSSSKNAAAPAEADKTCGRCPRRPYAPTAGRVSAAEAETARRQGPALSPPAATAECAVHVRRTHRARSSFGSNAPRQGLRQRRGSRTLPDSRPEWRL